MKENGRGDMKKFLITTALTLCVSTVAFAQVTSINSVKVTPKEYNDVPGSTLNVINNYPTVIQFDDQNVSAASGYANRDVWRFSNDNGATALALTNNSFFEVWMDLTLVGSPTSPRKEAGFLFDTLGGQGQFIVNTDAHEVVAFGGPLPFYSFLLAYNSGNTLKMGMTYFLDTNTGKRKIIYHAGNMSSPALEFTNNEQGIIDNSTLGGYFQIVNDPNNASNGGTATFGNITIVPEPTSLLALGAGVVGLMFRRRKA